METRLYTFWALICYIICCILNDNKSTWLHLRFSALSPLSVGWPWVCSQWWSWQLCNSTFAPIKMVGKWILGWFLMILVCYHGWMGIFTSLLWEIVLGCKSYDFHSLFGENSFNLHLLSTNQNAGKWLWMVDCAIIHTRYEKRHWHFVPEMLKWSARGSNFWWILLLWTIHKEVY